MRDYEVVYIFNSQLEEEVESKLDSYHEQITDDGSGEVTAVEDWGKRQLAYPIEDQENGHYVVAHFTVDPERLEEFERVLKLDGDLLRYLVVLHEEELPTPPSARRPGAGPDEEDEEGEEAESGEDADEAEEPAETEDEESESDESADEDDEAGGEDGDAEEDSDEDEEADEETTDDEESDTESDDEESEEESGDEETEDEETEDEASQDEASDEDEEEKE